MDYAVRTPQQLGQVLKSCRKHLKLTQNAMGEKVGLRQSLISQVENHGAGAMSVASLYRMMAALGLELVVRDGGVADYGKSEW